MAKGAIRIDWYPGAALDGMKFLTPMEELAYRRIIDLLYTNAGELPDDDETMAEQTRAFRDWKKVKAGLVRKGKITIADGVITNVKCTEILVNTQDKIEKARASGKASGEARRQILPPKRERPLNDRSANDQTDAELSYVATELVPEANASVTPLNSGAGAISFIDLAAQCGPGLADPVKEPKLCETQGEISLWREMGFDLERDVLPVLKARTAERRPRPINSWKYFTGAIAQANADRTRQVVVPLAQPPPRQSYGYDSDAMQAAMRKVLEK